VYEEGQFEQCQREHRSAMAEKLERLASEIRKTLKMKVSLTRKIHIMTLPHGTFLNAIWSEDQSATKPLGLAG
jgi:hypothetical protein